MYRTTIADIPGGREGVIAKVRAVRSLVERAKRNPEFRAAAAQLIAHVPEKDIDGEIAAMVDYARRIRYTRDPWSADGLELFTAPEVLLREVAQGCAIGDCDDHVLLASALLETIGYPTRYVVGGDPPDVYRHIWLEVEHPQRGWLPVELTKKDWPVGRNPAPRFPMVETLGAPAMPLSMQQKGLIYALRSGKSQAARDVQQGQETARDYFRDVAAVQRRAEQRAGGVYTGAMGRRATAVARARQARELRKLFGSGPIQKTRRMGVLGEMAERTPPSFTNTHRETPYWGLTPGDLYRFDTAVMRSSDPAALGSIFSKIGKELKRTEKRIGKEVQRGAVRYGPEAAGLVAGILGSPAAGAAVYGALDSFRGAYKARKAGAISPDAMAIPNPQQQFVQQAQGFALPPGTPDAGGVVGDTWDYSLMMPGAGVGSYVPTPPDYVFPNAPPIAPFSDPAPADGGGDYWPGFGTGVGIERIFDNGESSLEGFGGDDMANSSRPTNGYLSCGSGTRPNGLGAESWLTSLVSAIAPVAASAGQTAVQIAQAKYGAKLASQGIVNPFAAAPPAVAAPAAAPATKTTIVPVPMPMGPPLPPPASGGFSLSPGLLVAGLALLLIAMRK